MDILDLLMETHARNVSDLYVTAGAVPMLRLHGELTPLGKELSKEPCTE